MGKETAEILIGVPQCAIPQTHTLKTHTDHTNFWLPHRSGRHNEMRYTPPSVFVLYFSAHLEAASFYSGPGLLVALTEAPGWRQSHLGNYGKSRMYLLVPCRTTGHFRGCGGWGGCGDGGGRGHKRKQSHQDKDYGSHQGPVVFPLQFSGAQQH